MAVLFLWRTSVASIFYGYVVDVFRSILIRHFVYT